MPVTGTSVNVATPLAGVADSVPLAPPPVSVTEVTSAAAVASAWTTVIVTSRGSGDTVRLSTFVVLLEIEVVAISKGPGVPVEVP